MGLKDIIKRIKYGEPMIIVSGLPRSGTSMLMKMLEAGGMDILADDVRIPDDDNPQGYYEYEKVKNMKNDTQWLGLAEGKAVKIVSHLLHHLPDTKTYKVIFMKRNLEEVIASQNKMLERTGKPMSPVNDAKLIDLFENHLSWVGADHPDVVLHLILGRYHEIRERFNAIEATVYGREIVRIF